MAGFLSMLPGLFSIGSSLLGGLKSSGIMDTVKKTISGSIGDIREGRAGNWSQLGNSLKNRFIENTPDSDSRMSSSLNATRSMLENSNSANHGSSMIVPDHPRNMGYIPYTSTYKTPEVPMAAPANMVGQHVEVAQVKAPRRPRKVVGKRKHKSLYKK